MFTHKEVLDIAVQIERNGEKVYRYALENTSHEKPLELLRWLAEEEVKHVEWLTDLRSRFEGPDADNELEEMAREILQGILGSQSFSLEETDLPKLKDLNQLIDTAIEFEKDTVLFYEALKAVVAEEEVANVLNAIIKEERRHVDALSDFRAIDSDPFDLDT